MPEGSRDRTAVRCQLLYSSGGFIEVFIDARGGLFVTVRKASNRSVTVRIYGS
jgi:hypothetical protein